MTPGVKLALRSKCLRCQIECAKLLSKNGTQVNSQIARPPGPNLACSQRQIEISEPHSLTTEEA